MKYLIPLVLVWTLLCGCCQTGLPSETRPLPTESVAGEVSETDTLGGTVITVPLNLYKVQGLRVFQEQLLLFSGQDCTTLTLLDPASLEERASTTLTFQLDPEDPSLMFHPNGSLSYFDPVLEETAVLDAGLQAVRRIHAPGALSGSPILSEDGKSLFYCTASHVRAWDLESGIHRCIMEMTFDTQQLAGLHMGGTVVQCRIIQDGRVETLFLSAGDGSLLHRTEGDTALMTGSGRYFAQINAGDYRIPVFGTDPETPKMLIPGDLTGETIFLPSHMAALNASIQEEQVRLNYFNLFSGQLDFCLTLTLSQIPKAAVCLNSSTLALLIHDPAADRESLILWELPQNCPSARETAFCHTVPYHSGDDPDTAGLTLCRQQAEVLGQRYGIRILFGEGADVPSPGNCRLHPELLVPVLQRELTLLEQRLEAYPEVLLQETAARFSSLNLCLVRSLSGTCEQQHSEAGLHFLEGRDAYVVIPTGRSAAQALYHQLFHLMEVHIFSESNGFDQWDALNPAGFQYDYDYAANALRDSGVYLFETNRVFVDTFSMSYPKEDRARIMEYAMLPENDWLFRPTAMQKKLKILCTTIRDAYGLEDSEETFLWEQYLE